VGIWYGVFLVAASPGEFATLVWFDDLAAVRRLMGDD
jgi:hypothetical protein